MGCKEVRIERQGGGGEVESREKEDGGRYGEDVGESVRCFFFNDTATTEIYT